MNNVLDWLLLVSVSNVMVVCGVSLPNCLPDVTEFAGFNDYPSPPLVGFPPGMSPLLFYISSMYLRIHSNLSPPAL